MQGLWRTRPLLGGERLAEQKPLTFVENLPARGSSGDEPLERPPPRLDRTQEQVVAFEAHQVEGHERGLGAPPRLVRSGRHGLSDAVLWLSAARFLKG